MRDVGVAREPPLGPGVAEMPALGRVERLVHRGGSGEQIASAELLVADVLELSQDLADLLGGRFALFVGRRYPSVGPLRELSSN